MIEGIITYIRSWFPTNISPTSRKRRATDNFHTFSSPKYRKILSPISLNDDDWFSSPVQVMRTRRSAKETPVIVLDDEKPQKATSTPQDDVVFVKCTKKAEAKGKGLAPFSNGARPKISPISRQTPRRNVYSPSMDYSIRLDDHRKYKEMLENLSNNSSVYRTPVGKFFDYDISNRAKKMINLARSPVNRNRVDLVDLTNDSMEKARLSTKDRVIKVLDDFVEINDSDSDIEILPNPPSPKPDIKVDPVNSLRTVIDTNESTKHKWLKDKDENLQRYFENKRREIDDLSANLDQLSVINREILLKNLTRKVNKSLEIRDIILPIEEKEEEIELPELTDQHLKLIRKAFNGDPNEVLSKKFSLNVTRRDIQTLAGLNWLNDNIINFYMNLIIERGKKSDKWPKAYCMNTFFYQKLTTSGPESLKRWTRRVDIFENDFICVPIHLGVHWCMAIVNLKGKTIKYYDSMGQSNNNCLKALRNYLEFEHMDKKNEPFDTSDFQFENVADIPQQMNGSDCGMFSCTFAEFATRRAKFTFDQEDMPYLRKKMVVEIVTGELLIQ